MKTIVLFRRRPDLTRAAFQDYYETRHVPLAIRHLRFDKYVRNHLVAPAGTDFDVLSEFWLADAQAAAGLAASPSGALLREDEARFMTVERFRAAAKESLVAGTPRGVDSGSVRKYALLLHRPAAVAEWDFLESIKDSGRHLFAGGRLARVTLDIVRPIGGGSFPADAILSLWPNGRFDDSVFGAEAGLSGMLTLESHETAPESLSAAFA